ncbi:MAG: hypothetical protein O3B01_16545 [Planctomycetota bacterium]|nr:hypothetical protein [Planctomycetota bacterium]
MEQEISSPAAPRLFAGGRRWKAGGWRWKAGDWTWKAGDWTWKAGGWRWNAGDWRWNAGDWTWNTGGWRWKARDCWRECRRIWGSGCVCWCAYSLNRLLRSPVKKGISNPTPLHLAVGLVFPVDANPAAIPGGLVDQLALLQIGNHFCAIKHFYLVRIDQHRYVFGGHWATCEYQGCKQNQVSSFHYDDSSLE